MSIWTTANVAYGVKVPESLTSAQMEERLKGSQWGDVGFIMAGKYDEEHPYLVTFHKSADLGECEFFIPQVEDEERWDEMLAEAMEHNGWPWQKPSWFVVAGQS